MIINMNQYTDQQLKELIADHIILMETSVLPTDSKFRLFTQELCIKFGHHFDFHFAETVLAQEVFKRFIEKTNVTITSDQVKELRESLTCALPYVVGAYDCAFPDQNENDYVKDRIQNVLNDTANS